MIEDRAILSLTSTEVSCWEEHAVWRHDEQPCVNHAQRPSEPRQAALCSLTGIPAQCCTEKMPPCHYKLRRWAWRTEGFDSQGQLPLGTDRQPTALCTDTAYILLERIQPSDEVVEVQAPVAVAIEIVKNLVDRGHRQTYVELLENLGHLVALNGSVPICVPLLESTLDQTYRVL